MILTLLYFVVLKKNNVQPIIGSIFKVDNIKSLCKYMERFIFHYTFFFSCCLMLKLNLHDIYELLVSLQKLRGEILATSKLSEKDIYYPLKQRFHSIFHIVELIIKNNKIILPPNF